MGSKRRAVYYDDDHREYFFDRDPQNFRLILNYYQTGNLHFPTDCLSSFKDELQFFRIETDVSGDCCTKNFEKFSEDNRYEREEWVFKPTINLPAKPTNRQRMWRAFENPETSTVGKAFYYLTGFLIIAFLLENVVRTMPDDYRLSRDGRLSYVERYQKNFVWFNIICVSFFTLEYLLRLYAAPARMKYMKSVMGLIDVAVILPFYLGLLIENYDVFYGASPLMVLKFSRYSKELRIWGLILKNCASELKLLVIPLALFLTVFATAVYYAEKDVEGTNFISIHRTLWFAFITVTTIG